MEVKRYPGNPILKPNPANSWENYAVFNGCTVKQGTTFFLIYRAMGDESEINGQRFRPSVIGIAESSDGVNFTNRRVLVKPEFDWEKLGCEDPRVTFIEGNYYIFYTAVSSFNAEGIRVALAVSPDLKTITEKKMITPFNAKAMALFPEKINEKYAVVLTADTDIKPSKIAVAYFEKLDDLANPDLWRDWYSKILDFVIPLQRINKDQLEVGAAPIKFGDGWLFVYSYIKNYLTGKPEFRIEAVLLDPNDPVKYIARLEKPILEPTASYEASGVIKDIVFPSGALIEGDQVYIYYGAADTNCCLLTISTTDLQRNMRRHANEIPKLVRIGGPIIKPNSDHPWEAKATFNPAAFDDGQKIHLIYRAMSFDNSSVLGHADSLDGFTISERDPEPIYVPKTESEFKKKPFGNSGVEDPRVTLIGDTIYMCYTAYNGIDSPRVALTSIKLDDFKNHRWNWKNPVLITKPDMDDKDACILPEKLDDRYVIFHRIGRNIVFDYADTLDLDGNTFFEGSHQIMIREKLWDGDKIGICCPPIKTKDGWLMIYHGVSTVDHEYRVGAMLLYPKHPSIVLARTPYPLLEPDLMYERYGHINNVVFPCGSVLRGDDLFVYYGAADQMVGVAKISLSVLLNYLEEIRDPAHLG